MFDSRLSLRGHGNELIRPACVVLALAASIFVSGCGSTRGVPVAAGKTVTHHGSIYNVSEVRQLTTRLEGKTAAGEVTDLGEFDKRRFDTLVKEQGAVQVTSLIVMDDLRVVYEQKSIEHGRDLVKMQENVADAYKELKHFLADPKKTQLHLKSP